MGRLRLLVLFALASLMFAGTASASPYARYGIQDDAWLAFGPGTLDHRLDVLDGLGVKIVRYTVRWDQIATTRPALPRWSGDPAYTWGSSDEVLEGLHDHGIPVVATIYGAPRWTNGGHGPNWAPLSGVYVADFARAAAERFPWVRDWLIWNEPNKAMFLHPTSPKVYVRRILNPAYTALHSITSRMRVGGGVTAPRGGAGGVSPVMWIRGMRAAHARLDAYAHNPYPDHPGRETPSAGGCRYCLTITMATLGRLLGETKRAWGTKRIWLTEYGYQTNPPDRFLGVSRAKQARYVGEAGLRVYRLPRVDMLIHFLLRDDPRLSGWQSGFFDRHGRPKKAVRAFPLPLAQLSRRGLRTVLWGQVRANRGRRPYRLQQYRRGWHWVGSVKRTSTAGFFTRVVRAGKGSKLRIWSPLDRTFSLVLVVR